MSRSSRASERLYLASAIGALIASCSIPEHDPVLAETGGAGAAQGGALQGGSGGKNAGSGGTGAVNSSGGAEPKGTGGSGTSVAEGGAGGTSEGGAGAATGGDGGAAGGTDMAGAGGTSTGGASGTGGASTSGGSGGAANKGGSGGTSATGGTGGKSSTGGTGGTSATGGTGGTSTTGGTGGKSGSGGSGGKSNGCGAGDVGPEGPSCTGLSARCGPVADSCCASLCVPGGSFTLGGAVQAQTSQATISSYFLDKYEVTVGRFRKFVNGYNAWRAAGNPQQDAAKHPLIASSGWQAAWSSSLPANAGTLLTRVTSDCSQSFASWSTSNDNDPLPMNCVDWFQAFAFCAWDGGRLPTETEWEYAAAGGDDQRPYPWGSQAPSSGRANYGCLDGPSGCASLSALVPAGSKPNGAGRWGHNDLAGSVWEWVLDLYQTPYPATRTDGAVVIQTQQLFLRVFRSSNFGAAASELPVAIRQNEEPTARGAYLGLRCARLSSP